MKRLIYAAVILIALISLAFYSHFAVNRYCNDTINDVQNFASNKITSETLTKSWNKRKNKMSIYVNHDFLDQITMYIGQMILGDNHEDENFKIAYKNIETLIKLIREEQKFAAHSFY